MITPRPGRLRRSEGRPGCSKSPAEKSEITRETEKAPINKIKVSLPARLRFLRRPVGGRRGLWVSVLDPTGSMSASSWSTSRPYRRFLEPP